MKLQREFNMLQDAIPQIREVGGESLRPARSAEELPLVEGVGWRDPDSPQTRSAARRDVLPGDRELPGQPRMPMPGGQAMPDWERMVGWELRTASPGAPESNRNEASRLDWLRGLDQDPGDTGDEHTALPSRPPPLGHVSDSHLESKTSLPEHEVRDADPFGVLDTLPDFDLSFDLEAGEPEKTPVAALHTTFREIDPSEEETGKLTRTGRATALHESLPGTAAPESTPPASIASLPVPEPHPSEPETTPTIRSNPVIGRIQPRRVSAEDFLSSLEETEPVSSELPSETEAAALEGHWDESLSLPAEVLGQEEALRSDAANVQTNDTASAGELDRPADAPSLSLEAGAEGDHNGSALEQQDPPPPPTPEDLDTRRTASTGVVFIEQNPFESETFRVTSRGHTRSGARPARLREEPLKALRTRLPPETLVTIKRLFKAGELERAFHLLERFVQAYPTHGAARRLYEALLLQREAQETLSESPGAGVPDLAASSLSAELKGSATASSRQADAPVSEAPPPDTRVSEHHSDELRSSGDRRTRLIEERISAPSVARVEDRHPVPERLRGTAARPPRQPVPAQTGTDSTSASKRATPAQADRQAAPPAVQVREALPIPAESALTAPVASPPAHRPPPGRGPEKAQAAPGDGFHLGILSEDLEDLEPIPPRVLLPLRSVRVTVAADLSDYPGRNPSSCPRLDRVQLMQTRQIFTVAQRLLICEISGEHTVIELHRRRGELSDEQVDALLVSLWEEGAVRFGSWS